MHQILSTRNAFSLIFLLFSFLFTTFPFFYLVSSIGREQPCSTVPYYLSVLLTFVINRALSSNCHKYIKPVLIQIILSHRCLFWPLILFSALSDLQSKLIKQYVLSRLGSSLRLHFQAFFAFMREYSNLPAIFNLNLL